MKRLGILRSAQVLAPALGLLMLGGCGDTTPAVPNGGAKSIPPSLFLADTTAAQPLRPLISDVAVHSAVLPVIYPVEPLPAVDDAILERRWAARSSQGPDDESGPVMDLPTVNDDAGDLVSSEIPLAESSASVSVSKTRDDAAVNPRSTRPEDERPGIIGNDSLSADNAINERPAEIFPAPKFAESPAVVPEVNDPPPAGSLITDSSRVDLSINNPLGSDSPTEKPPIADSSIGHAQIESALIGSAAVPFGPSQPGPELTAVARRADAHVARGVRLAEKGAMFSARAEFIEALKLIAGALDAQRGTNAHARALRAGLRALEEANDFVPRGTAIDSSLNLGDAIAGHQTPVLQAQSLAGLTPAVALAQYLTYAQEQFGHSGGDLSPAASAYYGLGKLQTAPQAGRTMVDVTSSGKAVVFYQAALIVDRRHHLAANELGVLLARHGRLNDARALFLHSISISSQPVAWKNLSAVHRDLGEADLAQRAQHESQLATKRLQQSGQLLSNNGPQVQWIDPATFARSGQAGADSNPAAASTTSTQSNTQPKTAQKPVKQRGGVKSAARLPWELPDRK